MRVAVDVAPYNHLAGRQRAGFGEKDCAPFSLTTLIVTTPLGGGGVGVGVGEAGVPPALEELPQPHVHELHATITLETIARMSFLLV